MFPYHEEALRLLLDAAHLPLAWLRQHWNMGQDWALCLLGPPSFDPCSALLTKATLAVC